MHSSSSRTPVALLAATAVCLSFIAAPARGAESADAHGVGVARISFVRGAVAVRRGDSATPVDAALNAPVLGGDYVTTGDGARAEVEFDRGSAVRLDQDVQLRFTRLDSDNRRLQLAAGTVDLRVLRGTGESAEVDTPSVAVRPRAAGSYRVSVDADGATAVTVRSGAADVLTPQGTRALLPGTTLAASGSADAPVLASGAAPAFDDFDGFNGERDTREQRALSNAYVAEDVGGVDDLSDYGRWVSDGSYGNVWVPSNVAPDWAPYRYGRWVWEDYYGWTWVADEPWGWAPYHYGNWYHSAAYGWSWYPGRPHAVAFWRPALVAFFAFGNGGWGLGNIGWVPLAPFEPYHPWWGSRYNNVTNVTNVTNNYYGPVGNGAGEIARYANARANGVTAIGAKRFTEGRFEHPRAVGAAQLGQVAVARGPLPIVPTEANLRFKPGAAAAPPEPRRALVERTFAGRAEPVTRTPFEQQRSALAGFARSRGVPALKAVPVTNGTSTNAASPWARFGTHGATPVDHPLARPAGTAPTVSGKPRVPLSNDPWSRFDRAHGTTTMPATGTTTTTGASATGTSTHVRPAGGSAVPRHTRTQAGPAQAGPATTTTTKTAHGTAHAAAQPVHAVTHP
jgi:hypothetical protein